MRPSHHLTDLDLSQWLEGSPPDRLMAHAYGCTDCAVLLEALDQRPADVQIPDADQALRLAFEAERAIENEEQLSNPASLRIAEALRTSTTIPDHGQPSAGLIRNLLRSARGELGRDPALALRISDCALHDLEKVNSSTCDAQQLILLLGEVQKERANALRLLGRFPEGLTACDEAESAFSRLTVSEPWLAMCAYVRATILRELDQLQTALQLTSLAAATFDRFGMEQRVVHCRILESTILLRAGQAAEATSILQKLIELPLEPLERAYVLNDLSFAMLRLNHIDAALENSLAAVTIFDRAGATVEGLRSLWNLAKGLLAMKNATAAFPLLDEIRSRFALLDIREEETLVLLDIAEGLLEQGYGDASQQLCQALIARQSYAPAQLSRILITLDAAIRNNNLEPGLISDLRTQLKGHRRPVSGS